MEEIKVIHKINNLEILSKLMNSVAEKCNCRVKYNPEDRSIRFAGEARYKEYIADRTLSFFRGV